MRRIPFHELSRPVQERFIDATSSRGLPQPILARPGGGLEKWLWIAVGMASLAATGLLVARGYGNLHDTRAIAPARDGFAYGVLLGLAGASLLRALLLVGHERALPFPAGVYLFPSALIDARRAALIVVEFRELVVDVASRRVAVRWGGHTIHFAMPTGGGRGESTIKALVEQAKTDLERVSTLRAKSAMAALDPLEDAGFSNPFLPRTSIVPPRSRWGRLTPLLPLVAFGVGVGAGPLLLRARNVGSGRIMLASARALGTMDAYRAFLANGGADDEVANICLPRAELREAARSGTVAAIEQYVRVHPDSRISSEVAGALHTAMLTELAAAKRTGTLAALHEFRRSHPEHRLDADLGDATHQLYVSALEQYRSRATDREHVLPFVERLIAYAELHGPRVDIRFGRKWLRALEKADLELSRSKYFAGTPSLPSRYFDDVRERRREADLGTDIGTRFKSAFPEDILAFTLGDPLVDGAEPLPEITVPTLFIVHSADMSGGTYTMGKTKRVYAAMGFGFDVVFRIPDDPKPLKFRLGVWRPPDLSLGRSDDVTEEIVYEATAREGFAQFAKKLWSIFFAR